MAASDVPKQPLTSTGTPRGRTRPAPRKTLADEARELLTDAGLQPGPLLGAGMAGVVFADLATGGVIKLTRKLQEAAIALWLLNDVDEVHPGIAKHTGGLRLPAPWRHQAAYLVLREELPDAPALGRRFYSAVDGLERALRKELIGQAPRGTAIAALAERIRPRLDGADLAAFEQLLSIFAWASIHGLSLMGLHEANLGRRGEQLVVRDYSSCWPPRAWVKANVANTARTETLP